jgi:hypothetical protein
LSVEEDGGHGKQSQLADGNTKVAIDFPKRSRALDKKKIQDALVPLAAGAGP